MDVGTHVTYAKIKETQHIEAERRSGIGVIREMDVIDGEQCAKVEWQWGFSSWVRCGLLETTPKK